MKIFQHGGILADDVKTVEADPAEIYKYDEKAGLFRMRLAFICTSTIAVTNPFFDFTGDGSAGTFMPLPFRSVALVRERSAMLWGAAASGATAVAPHRSGLRSPALPIALPNILPVVTATSPAGTSVSSGVLQNTTIFNRSAFEQFTVPVIDLIYNSQGFSFFTAPLASIGGPTVTNFQLAINDTIQFQWDLEFKILQP